VSIKTHSGRAGLAALAAAAVLGFSGAAQAQV